MPETNSLKSERRSPIRLVEGTGRFRSAEGWFRLTGDFSKGAQDGGNYLVEGWISSAGSKK